MNNVKQVFTKNIVIIVFHFLFFSFHFLQAQSNYPIPYFVETDQLFGYKSADGKSVKIAPQYSEASKFNFKVARVKTTEGYFLINKKGKPISAIYDFIGWTNESIIFNNEGYSSYSKNGSWGILLYTGEVKTSLSYKEIKFLSNDLYAYKNKTGLWGINKITGDKVCENQFNELNKFTNIDGKSIALATKNNRYGLINAEGHIVKDFIYKKASFNNDKYELIPFPKWEITNKNGEILQTWYYDQLENIGPNIYSFNLNGESGVVDNQGNVLLENKYDSIGYFQGNPKTAFVFKNSLMGVINTKLEELLSPEYKIIKKEKNGNYSILKNGKEVFFDPKGNQINLSQYDVVLRSSQGNFKVKKDDKWGMLNENFELIINCVYKELDDFIGNYAAAKNNNNFYGIINKIGYWEISPVLDSAKVLNEKIFVFWENNIWGTINSDGIEIFQGTGEAFIKKDYVKAKIGNKWGVVGGDGFKKLDFKYDSIGDDINNNITNIYKGSNKIIMDITKNKPPLLKFPAHIKIIGEASEDGYFPAKIYNGYGFVDYIGQMWISNQYDSIKSFSEGIAVIKLGAHWGAINKYEELIIQPYYDGLSNFKNKRSIVKKKGKFGLIDDKGKIWIPIEFDKLEETKNGNWLCYQNNKMGIYSREGKGGIYPKYNQIIDLKNNYVIYKKDGKYGIDNFSGVNVIFHNYDKIKYNSYDDTFFLISTSD